MDANGGVLTDAQKALDTAEEAHGFQMVRMGTQQVKFDVTNPVVLSTKEDYRRWACKYRCVT